MTRKPAPPLIVDNDIHDLVERNRRVARLCVASDDPDLRWLGRALLAWLNQPWDTPSMEHHLGFPADWRKRPEHRARMVRAITAMRALGTGNRRKPE